MVDFDEYMRWQQDAAGASSSADERVAEDLPLSKADIRRRLHRAVPRAIQALEDAMSHGEHGEAIKAAQIILDRAGYGPKSTVQIEELPDDLSNLSAEELAARAERLAQALKVH